MARSPDTVSLLSLSAEDATSTKEGVACLFLVTTVTSTRSELEAEDELKRNCNLWDDPSRRPVVYRDLPQSCSYFPDYLVQTSDGFSSYPLHQACLLRLRRRWLLRGCGGSRHPHRYHCHHHGRRHPRSRHPHGGSPSDHGCRRTAFLCRGAPPVPPEELATTQGPGFHRGPF